MKAQLGDYIRLKVVDGEGYATWLRFRVVRIDGDRSTRYVGYELEDGTLIGDWEITPEDVARFLPTIRRKTKS